MRRGWAAAIAITAGMILPTAAFCQENAAKEDTYEGEAMCRLRRGVFPHPVYRPEPEYDNQARKKKGLDQQAIKAVSRWRFEPVTQDGQPCPMRVQVEVSFHLY
ncbi:MAG: TonB family protein [Terriglobales bacterium]